MLVFIAFIMLLALTAGKKNRLALFRQKNVEDWFIDGIGLFFQGILIPILQLTLVYHFYKYFLPSFQGVLNLHPIAAFALSFIFVDYLYYWNHRWLHSRWLWDVHQVHHTVTEMDVLGTSRNTLWTSFLIIYLWIHALFIFLLQNPAWYVLGASLTSVFDLWRHSALAPSPTSLVYRWLSSWLILPQDHAWHHASSCIAANYAANFKLWDKIHGTYYESEKAPDTLGIETHLTLAQKLLLPFRG
jgi:sterol desaturase/sphingolipid hydroxylase (fatty acid hydroxylase superfamily)